MGTCRAKLTGLVPLIQHNERLADPLDPMAKKLHAITTRKRKTDADHEDCARVEWEGGMYFDDKLGPYVPATWLDALMKEGARKNKLGTAFEAAVQCADEKVPIRYKGPRDLEAMYKAGSFRDRRGVGQRGNKIMRTRPRFSAWSLEYAITFDENEVNKEQIVTALENAGRLVGLGDYRPRFGRFTVSVD